MAVKHFESAPRTEQESPRMAPLPFTLPGDSSGYVYVGTPPKQSVWQRASIATRSKASDERKIVALVDFLRGTLARPTDGEHFEDRVYDPADKLDVPDLLPAVTWLSERWTAQMRDPAILAADLAEFAAWEDEQGRPPASALTEAELAAEPAGVVVDVAGVTHTGVLPVEAVAQPDAELQPVLPPVPASVTGPATTAMPAVTVSPGSAVG